jgi:hypothetical protein
MIASYAALLPLHQQGFAERHSSHLAFALGPAIAIALGSLIAERRHLAPRSAGSRPGERSLWFLAGMSLVAGGLHALVCPEHFSEDTLYGVFFLVAAAAQIIWAGLVVARPRRFLLELGLLGNAFVVGLWVITRTAGIPLGAESGTVEAIGALDVVASLCEVGIVAGTAWVLFRVRRPVAVPAA